MSDHDFEKQVRRKLDELKIPPSDQLWSSVEARIKKDRRRRRGMVFFPLFLLLVGGGIHFTLQNYLSSGNDSVSKSASAITNDDNTENRITSETKTEGKLAPGQPLETKAGNTIQPANEDRHDEPGVDESPSGNAAVRQSDLKKPVVETSPQIHPLNTRGKSAKTKHQVVLENENTKGFQNDNVTASDKRKQKAGDDPTVSRNISDQGKSVLIGVSAAQEKIHPNKQINPVSETAAPNVYSALQKNDLDSATEQLARMQVIPFDSAATATTAGAGTAAARRIRSSIKFGFSGSLGMSNLSDGGFFSGIFDNILGAEKAMVADVSPIPNNQSNAAPAPVVYEPSEIQKGTSFALGAFIQKSITKRVSISTGIQYRFYSTHIRVGNRVDSFAMVQNAFGSMNINQYYRAVPVATTQEYTNRFHFVELPLSGHLQLNKGNRLPISWNAGVSLSYLVSTSVLHFDSRTGLYYRDNDFLNRLQAGISTGFGITLWNASRLSVELGPQLQYSLTDLMKQEVSGGKHLFYVGLNGRVFLKK